MMRGEEQRLGAKMLGNHRGDRKVAQFVASLLFTHVEFKPPLEIVGDIRGKVSLQPELGRTFLADQPIQEPIRELPWERTP